MICVLVGILLLLLLQDLMVHITGLVTVDAWTQKTAEEISIHVWVLQNHIQYMLVNIIYWIAQLGMNYIQMILLIYENLVR
jgi:hypothetical protein